MPAPRSGRAALRALLIVLAIVASLLAVTPAHAAGASISGKVTKPSGNGLADSVVDLYREDGDGYYYYEKSVKTRSDGKYTFSSLPRDKYVVGFGAESKKYAAEFWNNVKEFENAREISLGSSSVSGVSAKLAIGGTVVGRVTTGPSSRAVAGAEVAAYRLDEAGWTFDKSVLTASDGSFVLGGLTEGRFTLEYNPPWDGPDSDLAVQYYPGRRAMNKELTFALEPDSGHVVSAANLPQGGRISGRVTGPDGEPVAGAPVFAYPGNEDVPANIAVTEDDGSYVMKGLSAGEHRLEFYGPYAFDNGYISEWWNDSGTFDDAEPVTVTAGETAAGIDALLALEGTAIVNTARPAISGTAKAGEVLTADPGMWSIENIKLDYQWFANGSPIEAATGKTYTIGGQNVGKTISVEVTGSRTDHEPGTAMSESTAPVAAGTFTLTKPPVIHGAIRVGDQAGVTQGTWNMADPNRSYQLLMDGADVPGATTRANIVTPDMLGKRLSYRETVSLPGFVPASATTEESAPIIEGVLTQITNPSLDGDAIAGVPVTAKPGTFVQSGPSDTTLDYSYRWFIDGTEIPGANSAELTPTAAQAGHALSVEVTGSRAGYTSATRVSVPATVNEAGTIPITQGAEGPSISGTPRVGSTLTADAGDWKPTPSSFVYQWLADGVAIDGANGSTFKPTVTEGGKRISVTVTASRSGYAPGTATSSEAEPVLTSTPFGAPQGLEATKSTVTYIDLAWTKVDNAAKYRIYYGIGSGTRTKVEVGDVTSARLRNLKPDKTYSIDIAALTSNGTRSPYSPRINVRTKPLVPPTDFAVTGQTRTSLTFTWTKVAGVPKYRIWYGVGSGTRTKVELGNVSTATITGLKPGTTYSVDIASRLSDGTKSAYTPRINATTAD